MKLHNLLLTAALFLAAGIASALDTNTPEQIQDPVFQRDSSKGYWTSVGNNTLDIVVIEHAKGYGYALVGFNTETQTWEKVADLNSGTNLSKKEKSPYSQIYKDFGGPGGSFNGANVYELDVTFDNTKYDKIGILGQNGSINQAVISALNNPATNKSVFTFLTNYENAVAFNNGGLKGIVVLKDASYVGDKDVGTTGAPLPAPIVTLLIALAFGGALVMYRKQAKA